MSLSADVVLNLIAFLGAGAFVLGQWRAGEPTPLDVRLSALLGLLMALVGVRALRWALGAEDMRHAEEALAAFVPLLALILAEGLLRRHAPRSLKVAAAVLGFALALAALMRPDTMAATFAIVLGIYIAGSLAFIGAWIAMRDRASLAPAENAAIGAFGAALVFALPLSATDFLAAQGYSPIRGGGLALLVLVFAAARVTATGGGGAMIVQEVVWAIAAAGLGFVALVLAFGPLADVEANVRLFGILLSLVLFFRIAQNVREQRRARMRASLWRAVAEAPIDRLDAFLERVLVAPELRGARLLQGADLADYDGAALSAAFADASLVAAADSKAHTGVAGEQLRVLLDACEATHAALISQEPLRLLLVNLPRLGAGPDADLQLRVLAKLAGRAGHA